MEMTDSSGYPLDGIDDYNLFDLMINEDNFDQFIVEGENGDPIVNFRPNDNEHLNDDCAFDHDQFSRPTFSDPSSFLNYFPCEFKGYEEENSVEKSSATITTTTTTSTKSSKKGDKFRTIISERKRRGRMKEKLYALRALVPNITKMDKASIVGDAALYVQELQTQAKKLRVDIERLELLLKGSYDPNDEKIQVTNTHPPISKKILQIDVFRVEEKGIYVRIVCNKGKGIAASLYKALESFSGFVIQTSILATVDDNFLLTVTLNVKELCEMEMDLGNLKLWVAGAFLNQGFDFMIFPSA